jgi:hypothetical protein
MKVPPRHWTYLQKLVWTMRKHGNEVEQLNLEVLARGKPFSADELLVEFRLQQNGSRKLPEEKAASCPPVPIEEVEE